MLDVVIIHKINCYRDIYFSDPFIVHNYFGNYDRKNFHNKLLEYFSYNNSRRLELHSLELHSLEREMANRECLDIENRIKQLISEYWNKGSIVLESDWLMSNYRNYEYEGWGGDPRNFYYYKNLIGDSYNRIF